jgi:hypothetical protein
MMSTYCTGKWVMPLSQLSPGVPQPQGADDAAQPTFRPEDLADASDATVAPDAESSDE